MDLLSEFLYIPQVTPYQIEEPCPEAARPYAERLHALVLEVEALTGIAIARPIILQGDFPAGYMPIMTYVSGHLGFAVPFAQEIHFPADCLIASLCHETYHLEAGKQANGQSYTFGACGGEFEAVWRVALKEAAIQRLSIDPRWHEEMRADAFAVVCMSGDAEPCLTALMLQQLHSESLGLTQSAFAKPEHYPPEETRIAFLEIVGDVCHQRMRDITPA